MREIEIKILEINRAAVEQRLLALNAKKTFDGLLHAVFFDFSTGNIRKKKDVLRLRKQGDRTFLTYKKFISNTKTKSREEIETEVASFEQTRDILLALGLHPTLEMKKRRISYALGKLHCEFDRYEDEYGFIPEFLEIEGTTSKSVFALAKKLGFSKKDCKAWSANDLARHYRKLSKGFWATYEMNSQKGFLRER